MTVALGRLGALYAEQGQMEAARRYGELAVEKLEAEHEPEIVAEQQVLLALTYRDLGEDELARQAAGMAAELYKRVGQQDMAERARQLIGELAPDL
jgi:tetratricopeptide (TPR) repeat protein